MLLVKNLKFKQYKIYGGNIMKVNEFIEKMTKDEKTAKAVVKKIIKTKYIPVLEKRQIAELVYNTSTSVENGVVKVDSLSKYLIFTLLMLIRYTDLEFTVGENGAATMEAIQEYDALCENGLINKIIAEFAEDYARCNEVLNYVFQDNLAVTNTVEAVIGRVANRLMDTLDNVADVLVEKVEEMDFDMSKLDVSGLENVMKLLGTNK